jgi:protein-S-isoprenylcysteine O-methyltransferase Ste14
MNFTDITILLAYGTLVIELTVFPIPSEASTLSLLRHDHQEKPLTDALSKARERSRSSKLLRFFLPTTIGICLFAMPLLATLWPQLRAAFFPIGLEEVTTLGLAFIIAGRLLTFSSVLQLRSAKRRKCIPNGLFIYSRNPGLVGMFIFYIGLCLTLGGPWLWLGLPLYFTNMHHRVLLEEAQLTATHGDSWREYLQRAARYLPIPGLK